MMGLEDMLPFLGNINGKLKMLVIYTDLSIFIIYKKNDNV